MGKDALAGAVSGVVGTAIAKSLVSSTVSTAAGKAAVETTANPSPYDIVKTSSGVRPVSDVQLNINTAATAAGNAASQTVNAATTPKTQPTKSPEEERK